MLCTPTRSKQPLPTKGKPEPDLKRSFNVLGKRYSRLMHLRKTRLLQRMMPRILQHQDLDIDLF